MQSAIRGIRNNNPFNIKLNVNNKWFGQCKLLLYPSERVFCQFQLMEYGIRAGLKLLLSYFERGYDTPSKIIKRFAPTSENNTSNYLDFVCRNNRGCFFLQPDSPIEDLSQLVMFALRIVKYECGLQSAAMPAYGFTFENFMSIIDKYQLNKKHVL